MATAFTMEQSFYTDRLIASGLSPIIPNESDRAETHRYHLRGALQGRNTTQSTAAYVAIASRLAASGADSLILGCTEVGMLLNQGNVAMPVFDTDADPLQGGAGLRAGMTDQGQMQIPGKGRCFRSSPDNGHMATAAPRPKKCRYCCKRLFASGTQILRPVGAAIE